MLEDRLCILFFWLLVTTPVLGCTVTYLAFAAKGLAYINNIHTTSDNEDQLRELSAVLSVSVLFTAVVIFAVLATAAISFVRWIMELLDSVYEEAIERAKNEMLPQAETCAEDTISISLEDLSSE